MSVIASTIANQQDLYSFIRQIIQEEVSKINTEFLWTLLASALAFISSISAVIFSSIAAKRRNRLDGITQHRVNWINNVRDIAKDLVQYENLVLRENVDYIKAKADFIESAEYLLLFLNVEGAIDRVISMYISEAVRNYPDKTLEEGKKSEYQRNRRELMLAIQIYLKAEWERVKLENKGKKYKEKNVIRKIAGGFLDQYDSIRHFKMKYEEQLKNKRPVPFLYTDYIGGECEIITSTAMAVSLDTTPSYKTPPQSPQP